ncbi:MAG: GH32 C-terminal domain-containing protein [Planctomycetota bacterium]|jgi:sucrose-6-phosphate hydrolase SacC (GH32 family)
MKRVHAKFITILILLLMCPGCTEISERTSVSSNTAHTSSDKTLVSWAKILTGENRGGSVLTIQEDEEYDGIIFIRRRSDWIAGSDDDNRTKRDKPITIEIGKMVQLAIVYEGSEVRMYQNGELINEYEAENIDLLNSNRNFVVFGMRHYETETYLPCEIDDARIYSVALSEDQLKKLKPNEPSKIKPYAWWDFEGDEVEEKTGRYGYYRTGWKSKGAELRDGKLILGDWRFVIFQRKYIVETPQFPDNPPGNWLTYHLVHPGPGVAEPGDPNPIYDYKGRCHLHYIYYNDYGFCYAHVSSDDMLHWKWHPTYLAPPITGHGMFSGTGFYTKDGTPAMVYHGEGSGTNVIAYALDDKLEKWTKPEAFKPLTEDGEEPEDVKYWDPDLWERDGTFYAISGGWGERSYMKSKDLKNWTYLGNLLHEDYKGEPGIPPSEDISCANMFKIGDKWMLICISHRLGCRYFLGDFVDEKYLPEFHARMNWSEPVFEDDKRAGGVNYFAPESFLTRDARRVVWTWLAKSEGLHPTGIQALPRELELPDDGVLRIKPLRELESLRYNKVAKQDITVTKGQNYKLEGITGDAVELKVTFSAPLPEEFGIKLLGDERGRNALSITAGANRETLEIKNIKPPFKLTEDEDLTLRVFIDKNLVEVFANDRQAAAVAHSDIRDNPNIIFFTKDAPLKIEKVEAWKMKSIYVNDTKVAD